MTLSTLQQRRLVELIRSEYGCTLHMSQFIEVVFMLIENISGFENPDTEATSELINNL